jgi:hypothetical protein
MGPLNAVPVELFVAWAVWVGGGLALMLWFKRASAAQVPPPAPSVSSTSPVRLSGVRAPGVHPSGVRPSGVRPPVLQSSGVRQPVVQPSGVRQSGVRTSGVHESGVRLGGPIAVPKQQAVPDTTPAAPNASPTAPDALSELQALFDSHVSTNPPPSDRR